MAAFGWLVAPTASPVVHIVVRAAFSDLSQLFQRLFLTNPQAHPLSMSSGIMAFRLIHILRSVSRSAERPPLRPSPIRACQAGRLPPARARGGRHSRSPSIHGS